MKRPLVRCAIVAVYCIVMAEIMSRIIVAAGWLDPYEFYGYPRDLFVQLETRGYGYRPNFQGHFPNGRFRSIPIEINSAGFRDDEYDVPGERVRLVALGDSITFGAGVTAADRWTNRVEDLLCSDGSCEVLNLGVNGYQIENYLDVALEQFATLKPDVVVIGFCLNDIRPKATFDYVAEGARERAKALLSHSVALRLLVWTARWLRHDPETYRITWAREAEAAWADPSARRRLKNAVSAIRDLAQGWGADVVAVLFPERTQLEDFERFGKPYRLAQELFEELEIPAILGARAFDASAQYPGAELEALFLKGDNVHYTAQGHEGLAQEIAQALAPIMKRRARDAALRRDWRAQHDAD